MSRKGTAFAVGSLIAALAAFSGAGTSMATASPPSLDGQRVYWFVVDPDSSSAAEIAGTCDGAGTSTIEVHLPSEAPSPSLQLLPDVGYFSPGVNPFLSLYPSPFNGPMTLTAQGTIGAHTLAPPPLDFTTGWINEQQSTRGLPAAPVTGFSGSATMTTPDAVVAIELSLPPGFDGFGSCHDDLVGADVAGLLGPGQSISRGYQARLKVLDLAYTATITTAAGVTTDQGTVSFSARNEFYEIVNSVGEVIGGASGGGVEMIFHSSAPTDSNGPTITCEAYTALLGQSGAVVTGTVTDDGSGVASSTVSASVDTSTVGARTVTLTATDLAGNTSSVECPYAVSYGYTLLGAFKGLPDERNKGNADNGATVVRWKLTDAAGEPAGGSTAVVSVSLTQPGGSPEFISGDSVRYLDSGNWQVLVSRRAIATDSVLIILLDDDTPHTVILR